MFSFFDSSRDERERALITEHAAGLAPMTMSWGAIIAGALTALVAQLVFNLLGLGIGLSAVDPKGGGASAEAFSIGAGGWILLSAIFAYAVGGYVSGRLSRIPARSLAGYHGLVTWALTTVVAIFLVTSAVGGVLGGAFGAVSGAFGGTGSALSGAVKAAAPQLSKGADPISGILAQLKDKAGDPTNVAARDDAIAAVKSALSSDPSTRDQATGQAADALAKLTGKSQADARAQVEDYEHQYDDLMAKGKETATNVAATAATAASRGALIASLALIIGALAAFFSGRFAAVRVQSSLVGSR